MEMRSADNRTRIAFGIPLVSGGGFGDSCLTQQQIRTIGEVADGEYLVAVTDSGKRVSNVARFKVDSKFDPAKEPTVRLIPVAMPPGRAMPLVGYIVTGPTPEDKRLTDGVRSLDIIRHPVLIIDGVERKVRVIKDVGMTRARPGERYMSIIGLAEYLTEPSPKGSYSVQAKMLEYQSATVTVPADGSLEREWDEMSSTAADRRAAKPLLSGKVTGPDGRPAAGYEVSILGEGGANFGEKTKADGSYGFVNVPEGPYQLSANPPGTGSPAVILETVMLEPGKTAIEDLSFEGRYSLNGTITFEDGTAAAGLEVAATFSSEDRRMTYSGLAKTDAKGRYEIKSPFEMVSYVEPYVDASTERAEPRRGMRASAGTVDFVLRRKNIRRE